MKKKKIILWIVLPLCVLLVLAGAFFWLVSRVLSREYLEDRIIDSPDGRYTLIVKEWDFLFSGGSEICLRDNQSLWGLRRYKTEIATKHNVHPFRDGNFRVIWSADGCEIRTYTGRSGQDASDESSWESVSAVFG